MDMRQRSGGFIKLRRLRLITRTPLAAFLGGVFLSGLLGSVQPLQAAFIEGGSGPDVVIGQDDDNLNNPTIQPPGVPANQSLNNTDILEGDGGNDVVIGLLGNDVLHGGPGDDILIGGTEQGSTPNSDIIFGEQGNDINIWAPGDGSDAFIGGPGRSDALVFGVIDRAPQDGQIVPTLTGTAPDFPQGVPTANVSGQGGFCTLEQVDDSLGYEFLVRFFVRVTGVLAVTIRTSEVEQVFCTSLAGGQIAFADLTVANPAFVDVTLEEVKRLNHRVARIIR